MNWQRSNRADPRALALADRHYSRQKPGTPQFVRNASNIVMLTLRADALWVERGAQLADAERERCAEQYAHESIDDTGLEHSADPLDLLPLFPPRPNDAEAWAHVLARVPAVEPAFCGVAASVASRMDRLRLTGNGVHPVAAAVALVSLWLEHQRDA